MKLPDTRDTIAAQATPPGAGAIAVIRLSGPRAFAAAASFIKNSPEKPEHASARLMPVMDKGRLIDNAVVIFYRGPSSYTGEDTVEISCHGSAYITRTIMNLAIRGGARAAGPGEFTLRAFLNGKLDLAQAEAVNDLISAGSAGAHRAAMTQVQGAVSARVKAVRAKLLGMLAALEARLDDTYEDIPALELRGFTRSSAAARREALALAAGFEAGRGIRDGLKVVITGAPNSGKSSLLNALAGFSRAIVSSEAGTTRDTLEAAVELEGFSVLFTDTAGLNGRPSGPIESEGIERAKKAMAAADTILLVNDASKAQTPSDRRAEATAASLAAPGAELIKVFNKSDLPPKRGRGGSKAALVISCRTGAGLRALKARLVAAQKKVFADGAQAVVTSARHYEALTAAAGELAQLEETLLPGTPRLELSAEHLRAALGALASILGETTPEEVLAEIFGSFCVGK